MTFIDTYSNEKISLLQLWEEWQQFRFEDPLNHAESFKTELFEILMASVNGRNDMDVIGLTNTELSDFMITLRKEIEK